MQSKEIILGYWNSWQKPDWEEMGSFLADEVNFGGHRLKKEEFIIMCQNGNPWGNAHLLSSVFTGNGGAIL